MPRCTSTPRGRLACSGGRGHTWGALSRQDTWQANEHTGAVRGQRQNVAQRPRNPTWWFLNMSRHSSGIGTAAGRAARTP